MSFVGLYGSVLSGYGPLEHTRCRLRATDPRSEGSKRRSEMGYFGVPDLMISRVPPPKWSNSGSNLRS